MCFYPGQVKRPVLVKSLVVEVTQKQKGRVVVGKVGGFKVRRQQFFYGRDLYKAVAPRGFLKNSITQPLRKPVFEYTHSDACLGMPEKQQHPAEVCRDMASVWSGSASLPAPPLPPPNTGGTRSSREGWPFPL